MGKTILYLALLAIMGTGVYFFLFRNSDGLYREKEANFTIRDTAAIGKIFLVQNDGQSLLIERGPNNRWLVNKKYPVMPVQVLNILTCLRMQSALTPVSDKEHDRVVKLLATLSTKVEVYNTNGEKIRSFFVAGQGPNFHGSYMILEGADQPYLVEVPGFAGYLTPRFSTDIAAWRARSVFDVPAARIRSVAVKYDAEPLSSFTVIQDKNSVRVEVDPQLREVTTELNEKRAHEYLGLYTEINNEGYLNGTLYMDSLISHSVKMGSIELTADSAATTVLDLYWMYNDRLGRQQTQNISDRPMDVDRMYAVLQNTHDTMVVQLRTFEKLLRRSYEFYTKDTVIKAARPIPRPSPLRREIKLDRT